MNCELCKTEFNYEERIKGNNCNKCEQSFNVICDDCICYCDKHDIEICCNCYAEKHNNCEVKK